MGAHIRLNSRIYVGGILDNHGDILCAKTLTSHAGQGVVQLTLRLTQQGQHGLRGLVGLCQDRCACLLQDVVFCLCCGFCGVVCIHDAAVGSRQVHRSGLQGGDLGCFCRHVGTR